jgi:hypothetical protein
MCAVPLRAASAVTTAGSARPGAVGDPLDWTTYDGIAGRYAFSARNHDGRRPHRMVIFRCGRGRWIRAG